MSSKINMGKMKMFKWVRYMVITSAEDSFYITSALVIIYWILLLISKIF